MNSVFIIIIMDQKEISLGITGFIVFQRDMENVRFLENLEEGAKYTAR